MNLKIRLFLCLLIDKYDEKIIISKASVKIKLDSNIPYSSIELLL